jgi:RNA polymerase sigma factor (sigma-70 family)
MDLTTEQVYNEYHKSILFYVSQRINDPEDARDLTQEIFIKAHRLIKTYSMKRGAISTWIHKIAYTAIIDHFRTNHQDKYIAVSNFINSNGDDAFQFEYPIAPTSILENKELDERIRVAFRELKPEYRRVATLYFVNEFRYEEIAKILDMKLGTVKGMISRSREMLKSNLEETHVTF